MKRTELSKSELMYDTHSGKFSNGLMEHAFRVAFAVADDKMAG